MDIEDYNARWLKAWTAKDLQALLTFYSADVAFFDPQTATGIHGHAALSAYLTAMFEATPPMSYTPDEVWATPNGYCGRWYCTLSPPDGPQTYLRGFDLVVLDGDKIVLNEVYIHPLEALPA